MGLLRYEDALLGVEVLRVDDEGVPQKVLMPHLRSL
jgi:hypothetical protein